MGPVPSRKTVVLDLSGLPCSPLFFSANPRGRVEADDSLVVVLEVLHSGMHGPVFPAVPLQFGTF